MLFSTRWQRAQKIFQAQVEYGFQLFENHVQTTIRAYPNRAHCALKSTTRSRISLFNLTYSQ